MAKGEQVQKTAWLDYRVCTSVAQLTWNLNLIGSVQKKPKEKRLKFPWMKLDTFPGPFENFTQITQTSRIRSLTINV